MRVRRARNGLATPLDAGGSSPTIAGMATALITCTTPRSMTAERAAAWLEHQADSLRDADSVEAVTLSELRPSGGHPVWLLRAAVDSNEPVDWEPLLGGLMRGLRHLGMEPTVCIDERRAEVAAPRHALLHAA
jgi:hypothetical protein